MSKFPDFSGFWEFPKDPKVIPIYVQNSQELGKFPESSHTERLFQFTNDGGDENTRLLRNFLPAAMAGRSRSHFVTESVSQSAKPK